MKIVFVLPAVGGGGAERVVLNLYKIMTQINNYECHIVSIDRKVLHKLDADVQVHFLDEASNVSKKGFGRFTYREKIANIVDSYIERVIGDDCIVLSNMMFADKIMSHSRLPVFHIIHSSYTQSLLGGKPFYKRFFIKRNINKVYSRHPMIFVSESAKASFCQSFSSDVDMYVIYNPVNDWEIHDLSTAESPNMGFDYLIHVGRFNRAKRHDRLLNAFSRTRSGVKLLILGEGRLESKIRSMVDSLGLADRVEIMGFKPNPYPYTRAAKALVLTSDFEGLPMVVLEAVALGVPVVATNCPGGMEEILGMDSPSLLPVDDIEALANAMDDVIMTPEKYTVDLQGKFTGRYAAEQYDALFRGLARNP